MATPAEVKACAYQAGMTVWQVSHWMYSSIKQHAWSSLSRIKPAWLCLLCLQLWHRPDYTHIAALQIEGITVSNTDPIHLLQNTTALAHVCCIAQLLANVLFECMYTNSACVV